MRKFHAVMASEPAAKKLNSCKRIGTHNATFHCDEVLACCMLQLLPQYENAEIIRTRDQNILDTCDVVVDVGGVYEPLSHKFDHHQRYILRVIWLVIYLNVFRCKNNYNFKQT